MLGFEGRSAVVGLAIGMLAVAACDPAPEPTPGNVSYLHLAIEAGDPFTQVDPTTSRQELDIRLPQDAGAPVPVMIVVPGGSWLHHDSNSTEMTRLLDDGFAVIAVNYRRAQTSTGDNFAQLAYDVDRAIRWVRAHHERLGIDPNRVILSGHSAGAHLAAAVAVGALPAPNDPTCDGGDVTCSPPLPPELAGQSSRPDGLVLLAGVYDLTDPALASLQARRPVADTNGDGIVDWHDEIVVVDPDPGTPVVEAVVENMLGCPPLEEECADAVTEASPSNDAHQSRLTTMPPTFIAHASNDPTARYQQSGVFGYRLCHAGATMYYEQLDPEGQEEGYGGHDLKGLSTDKIDQFLSIWNPASAPEVLPPATTQSCNAP